MANISQITLPDGNTYDIKDANATDTKVTQTATDHTSGDFEVLLSGTADNTTRTEGAKKTSFAKINPASQAVTFGSRPTNSTIGSYSYVMGFNNIASGQHSFAEGNNSAAVGNCSHSEGCDGEASGACSHNEGQVCIASGSMSHAEGLWTVANHRSQHVFGEFNIADDSSATIGQRGNYVEIVGNGTDLGSERSNARTLDWYGNEVLSGKLTVGTAPTNNMDVATKLYVDTGLASKQNTLTAGSNITIDANNEISATDTTYTAGTGINIDANNVISTTGGGTITDVQVDGVSVVTSGVAEIDLTPYVAKSGDTMTGNLIIKNATAGAVQITNPNTDLREADNNVSSAQFNQFRIVDDGSHMTMGYFGTTVYPEGLVQGTLQVSNFDTNGDPVSNGISLTVDKDGSKSYSVSDEAAFRRAIGVVNRPAANAGADLSLVTTGDKYDWNNKVSKSGDTMTGSLTFNAVANAIKYQGTKSTQSMIKFIDNTNDEYGNGIYIGGGGQTIIGGGESSDVMAGQVGTSGSEIMYVGNDGDVNIITNLQSGWASGKNFVFNTSGHLQIPGAVVKAGGNTSWIKGRDVAPVRTTSGSANWNPVVSAKSVNGSWELGTLNNTFYFSYATDTNYNAGTNTTNTISLDSSGNFSGSAAKLNGYASDTAASANTIVRRTADKYIYATYYNSNIGNENINSYTNDPAIMFTSNDKWIRRTTKANLQTWLGLGSAAYSNTSAFAAASHTHSYLPLSGGTLTGDVTISKAYPVTIQKNTAVTYGTSSNNGVSSNTYCCRAIRDKNNNEYASWNTGAYTDGHFESYIVVYNKQTNGTGVSNDLCIGIRKNGTKYYSVKGPSEFRSAIGAAASSSRAYKENIKDITNEEALKLLNINICSFDYKKGFGEEGKEKGHFGVIAEDVVKIIPSAVNIPKYYKEEEVDPKLGTKQALISVDYWKFIPHLIKLVQMQQKEIEELKEKVK